MNYLERIALMVWHATGETGPYPDHERSLWLAYAVLATSTGVGTTSEHVHDAWTLWATLHYTEFQHRSCVPFDDLADNVKAYDDEYRDAIQAVAHVIAQERIAA